MNAYKEMRARHQKEVSDFPMFFAFGNEQFAAAMKKLGLEPTDTDKIYSFGGTGGYYLRTDAPALHEMLDRHHEEMKKAMESDDTFAFDMFNYELGNHEYILTCDVEDTLEAIGLTVDEVNNNPRLSKALKKACKAQREWYAKHG